MVMPALFFLALIFVMVGTTIGAGRSPHVVYRPEQIDVRLDDVIGIDAVKEDVVRSLNLFLAHKAFREEMGGTPRRGLLFEGVARHGQDLPRQGHGGRGRGAVLLRVGDRLPVHVLRRHGPQDPLLLQGAPQGGPRRGRRHRLHRGDRRDRDGPRRRLGDAPCRTPSASTGALCCGGLTGLPAEYAVAGGGGLTSSPGTVQHAIMSEGVGGVVNELLVQMQSFDELSGGQKIKAWFIDLLNPFLPAHRQIAQPVPPATNVLLIAATNRADNLDPALLRPGRFDRRLTFETPARRGRRDLIDYFLGKKSHHLDLDDAEQRDGIASVTQGYTPVMIEHLFDEALVNALRRGDALMNRERHRAGPAGGGGRDGQPVAYTDHEKRLIATHEAGHATIAWLVAPYRRLEILTIVKRRDALGHARPRRRRGRLHAVAHRDAPPRPDRHGRAERRGAVLRRRLDRPGR